MAIITPNEGEKLMLAQALGLASAGGYVCALFQNNITPSVTTEYGDLTPCDFSGYATVNLSWSAPVTNGGGRAESLGNICGFTRDGTDPGVDNDAYGWFIYAPNSLEGNAPKIIAIELFGSPEPFNVFFRQLLITPTINLFSEF